MTPDTQAIEWAGLLAGSGVIGSVGTKFIDGWINRITNRKASQKIEAETGKFDADAAQVIASTAMALLAPLQGEVADLRTRIQKLEGENVATTGKLRRAINYIRELRVWVAQNVTPECPPPPMPPKDLDI